MFVVRRAIRPKIGLLSSCKLPWLFALVLLFTGSVFTLLKLMLLNSLLDIKLNNNLKVPTNVMKFFSMDKVEVITN